MQVHMQRRDTSFILDYIHSAARQKRTFLYTNQHYPVRFRLRFNDICYIHFSRLITSFKIQSNLKFNVFISIFCHIRYDPLSSCLVDFKGRANMASVKNFQLVHSSSADVDSKKSQDIDAEKDYILQVGKVR